MAEGMLVRGPEQLGAGLSAAGLSEAEARALLARTAHSLAARGQTQPAAALLEAAGSPLDAARLWTALLARSLARTHAQVVLSLLLFIIPLSHILMVGPSSFECGSGSGLRGVGAAGLGGRGQWSVSSLGCRPTLSSSCPG